ncbi:F0F1 ATP synthase subunit delta [Paenibacillus barengoltzii]|jgi:F-type H+-transporting ATPase subunit delta|uniref:ATP synthase subunit delta n=1 Tax=Paenibacillus barengoltzii J12 TaxID=935846 RepID=A0ABY1LSC6_9BACL|nr:F0F1 ATP synthase subunit delta [Paenibacillus barengoltzii]SME94365.1 F-type H+-transporting ATPase subunit delta [Paenibacillus barengoltzii J12]
MSREAVVANRYAKALFEIARQSERALELEAELKALVDALHHDPSIQLFIESPKISDTAKWDAIQKGLEGKVSQPIVSLVQLLIERGRITILPQISSSYTKLVGDSLGLSDALVYSTYPLSEAEKQQVADEFGALVNREIRVINEVDKELLGGIKVKIGDTLYDGSLAGKLNRLEKSFRRQAL